MLLPAPLPEAGGIVCCAPGALCCAPAIAGAMAIATAPMLAKTMFLTILLPKCCNLVIVAGERSPLILGPSPVALLARLTGKS